MPFSVFVPNLRKVSPIPQDQGRRGGGGRKGGGGGERPKEHKRWPVRTPGRALGVSRIQAEAAVPSSAPSLLLSRSLLLSFPLLLSYLPSSSFSSSPFVTRCQHSYSLWRSLAKGHKATREQRVHFSRSWRHRGTNNH